MDGVRLPPDPRSVGDARRFVRRALPEACSARLDDALLLVSELVTNAVVHARSTVRLQVEVLGRIVRVQVIDASRVVPTLRTASTEALSGRGIGLLQALADRWGVLLRDDGKAVWFDLEADGPTGRDQARPGAATRG